MIGNGLALGCRQFIQGGSEPLLEGDRRRLACPRCAPCCVTSWRNFAILGAAGGSDPRRSRCQRECRRFESDHPLSRNAPLRRGFLLRPGDLRVGRGAGNRTSHVAPRCPGRSLSAHGFMRISCAPLGVLRDGVVGPGRPEP